MCHQPNAGRTAQGDNHLQFSQGKLPQTERITQWGGR